MVELVEALADDDTSRFALAELSDFLTGLPTSGFLEVVDGLDVRQLSPFLQNYVSAMVEHAAYQRSVAAPRWASYIEPLELPYFAVPFPRLRMHLLRSSPVAFKRRNLFVDSMVGDRV